VMERAAAQQSMAWPTLTGQDLADLSAFFGTLKGTRSAPPPAK